MAQKRARDCGRLSLPPGPVAQDQLPSMSFRRCLRSRLSELSHGSLSALEHARGPIGSHERRCAASPGAFGADRGDGTVLAGKPLPVRARPAGRQPSRLAPYLPYDRAVPGPGRRLCPRRPAAQPAAVLWPRTGLGPPCRPRDGEHPGGLVDLGPMQCQVRRLARSPPAGPGGQCGGEPGEEDVEAAFEFGCALFCRGSCVIPRRTPSPS